ncbi:hypothetical protein [Streptomyces sp. Da 82-17]|uniref:hypothetical protein n=1 Tax=Streptomyces sp. Da 82-17 TaxID=3377116 RepID=UPI0038D3BD56
MASQQHKGRRYWFAVVHCLALWGLYMTVAPFLGLQDEQWVGCVLGVAGAVVGNVIWERWQQPDTAGRANSSHDARSSGR